MRQSQPILTLPMKATGAIVARRFITAVGAEAVAAGNALGVSRFAAAVGETVPVDVLGTAVVEAGGIIAAGALVEVGADGKAVAKNVGVTVARALEGSGGAGAFIEVLLIAN